MATGKALDGKPYAGNPHVRFDEGEVAPCTAEASLRRVHCRRQPEGRASVCAATPRRGSLLYKMRILYGTILAAVAAAMCAAEAKEHTLVDEHARATPDWFRKGVMYQIQPRAFTPEGTIKAAEGKLAELADLGVTVVYMCPVTVADDDPREDMWSPRQVRSGFNNPRNPYRTGDYFHVDPEYGTDADFRSFVKTAHDNGIKVLMDIVYLHCGPSARVVKDHPEYFSYDKNGKMVMAGWRFPKLNFDSRGVREYFKANMVYWLADFDVDGFRCDVADCIPLDFWEDARDACESVKGGIVMLAEGCRHANTRHAFDANYNWPVCLCGLRPILNGDSEEGYNQQWAACGADVSAFKGVAKLRAASEQYAAKCPKGTLNMNFTENHDTSNDDYENRMEKTCGWDNQTLGLALCFAMEGIPLIYNGQEIADAHRHSIFGHSQDVTVDWANAATPGGRRRREMVRAFAALRRDNPAMTAPGQKWLDNDKPESVLSLRRGESAANGIVFVGNFSGKPVTVGVESVAADKARVLLANGAVIFGASFRLAPWGFAFMEERWCAKRSSAELTEWCAK